MLSIVIPVYNAKEYLERTIESIFLNTSSKFELILIDDFSDKPTRDYLQSIDAPEINLVKVFNAEHKWTNYNWNLGVNLAKGEYIAILNSDILLPKDWDTPLIEGLRVNTISCPTEIINGKKMNLLPIIEKVDPKMIKGAAFMFKKEDVHRLFPIPQNIKHWCGDNILADRANGMQGVVFTDVIIKHFITRSGRTIDSHTFYNRVLQDVEAYEKLSDRNMKDIKDRLFTNTLFSLK